MRRNISTDFSLVLWQVCTATTFSDIYEEFTCKNEYSFYFSIIKNLRVTAKSLLRVGGDFFCAQYAKSLCSIDLY